MDQQLNKNEPQQLSKPEPRHKARLAIFYYAHEQRNIVTNYSVNINSGGVFIETLNILPVETMIIVKFKLPFKDPVITCNAKVAWTNEPGQLKKYSLPPGMGLHFIDLSLGNIHAIRDYLNKGDLVPTW